MGIPDILLLVFPLASGIAATAGYGVIALSPAEFKQSKMAFCAAGLLASIAIVIWGATSDVALIARIIVTFVLGGIISSASVEAIRWVERRESFFSKVTADPQINTILTAKNAENMSPPIGTLRFENPTLQIDHKLSTDQYAGQVRVQIYNDSDKLIKFHAITAGRINDIAFDANKVEFDGYIYPRQFTYLVSRRIAELPVHTSKDIKDPTILAFYEYELLYKYDGEKEFSRKSSRGIRFEYFSQIKQDNESTSVTVPIVVTFYNEDER